MSADHIGEAVECQHRPLSGTAARHDKIGRTGIQEHTGKDSVLHIGELSRILCRVHAVIIDRVAHRLHDLFQCLLDDGILGGLAVLVDECDLHGIPPFAI